MAIGPKNHAEDSSFSATINTFYINSYSNRPMQPFAAIAEKSLKEVTYRRASWSSEWVILLGDGT